MTKQIEALKMVIDFLNREGFIEEHEIQNVIETCKEALADAEKQEPVAWMNDKTPSGIFARHKEGANNFGCDIPLYTHPATWQSLSDDEIVKMANKIAFSWHLNSFDFIEFARAIEQALKEKNP